MTFDLLTHLYADAEMEAIFSEAASVEGWLAVEAAIALGLARAGRISDEQARAIADACVPASIDLGRLWEEARVVGYPILPLVRMICAALPADLAGYVHWGATTQDIMDSCLAMQLTAAVDRLAVLVDDLGDGLAVLTDAHRATVMAGRTHAQQAVPTTFGAKMAVFLGEVTRHRTRLAEVRERVRAVSLFGAGGTSAAMGEQATVIRTVVAAELGLLDERVPWHVARDRVGEFGTVCGLLAATAARFAREVVDLSRTEVLEAAEADGLYRGASSTMPQKANPISSEAIIGLAVSATAASGALLRAMEAGHERAAGEWQVEWHEVPEVACRTAAALAVTAETVRSLRVFPERMAQNLTLEGGAVMAEAWMMRLAETVGRQEAHEIVYRAVREAKAKGVTLADVVEPLVDAETAAALAAHPVTPQSYLGSAELSCDEALAAWRSSPAGSDD